MAVTDHRELIAVLTELYTLLDTLGAVVPNAGVFPPEETGVHPNFNASAARAAGYNDGAVELLASLPDLQTPNEIAESMRMRSHLGPDMDQQDFEECRELIEEWVAPSAIVLTDSVTGIGPFYIYDTERKAMFSYTPQNEDCETRYYDLIPQTPREALQPLIDKYRRLEYISHPTGDYPEQWRLVPLHFGYTLSANADDAQHEWLEEARRDWFCSRALHGMYLDCGWDVDTVERTAFRRAEFLDRRKCHLVEMGRWHFSGQSV